MKEQIKKKYEVWMEGHHAQGSLSIAKCIGTFEGTSFEDACLVAMRYYPESEQYYNVKDNSYWGMRLFNNSLDANKYF